jgi:hypothetical protein
MLGDVLKFWDGGGGFICTFEIMHGSDRADGEGAYHHPPASLIDVGHRPFQPAFHLFLD